MRRTKHRGLWVTALWLAVVYPFLFPHPQGRGLYLKPAWALDLDAAEQGSAQRAAGAPYTWFRAGGRFGYATLDGKLVHLDRVLSGVTLSDSGFVNYPKAADSLVFADPEGRFRYGLTGSGYPLIEAASGRLFFVSTDLTALRQVGPDGDTLWNVEFSSPLTTASFSDRWALVGLLEGRALLLDARGAAAYEFVPSGSRIPIVLGTAVSPGGDRLAVASGVDPQRLEVLEQREGGFAPYLTIDPGTDLRREMLLRFTGNGRYLLFERSDGVGVLDLGQKKEYRVPGAGRLREVAVDADSEMVALLADGGNAPGKPQGELRVLQLPQRVFSRNSMKVRPGFLRLKENHLFVGLEGTLLRIDIREES